MEEDIKAIAKSCFIDEKRVMHDLNPARIETLWSQMNKLEVNREVALYAYKLDQYYELKENNPQAKELNILAQELLDMEDNYDLDEYKALRWEYNHLMMRYNVYAKSINVDFRNKLKQVFFPNIYVYQEHNNVPLYRHIIDNNTYLILAPSDCEIIYPEYELKSNREYNHFYNKVSFKYLQQLSQDCRFCIENKSLGKAKVKKV